MSRQHNRRAVVFGGSGFVGTHLTSYLASKGYDVVIADLMPPRSAIHPDARFECVDVRRPIALPVSKPDIVFNLASVHRTPGHADNEYYDTNIAGAINVTRWCTHMMANQLLFTSSISVYGPSEEPKNEDSQLAPSSPYGRSKLLAEEIHREWASQHDRRLVIVRPAVVFGPGEGGNFTRLAEAMKARRFVYPGRDDTVKACGYVSDLVRSMLFTVSLSQPLYVFNYCYPQTYTIRQICEAFCEVSGYASPFRIPRPVVNNALRLLTVAQPVGRVGMLNPERIRKLTASTNVIPRRLCDSGFQWETDLTSGLRAWFNHDPQGVFA